MLRSMRWVMGLAVCGFLLMGIAAADPSPTPPAYRIGPNDVVRVQVFGEEDLTVEHKVGGDGTINFPLLGTVSIAGKTVRQLQDYLAARLAEGYVRSPRVTVFMVRYRNFYVSGEVKTPGGYPYEAGLTVQKAISMAGGFSEKAETRKIAVTRVVGDRTDTVILGVEAPILPDDILAVGPMQKFYVTGEVARPGRYSYEEQLTIKKALTLAGGLTEKADPAAIKVTRLNEAAAKTLAVGSDELVVPDDLIVVEAQSRKIYVSGEVKTPGSYPYKDGLTIQKVLALAGGVTEKADPSGIRLTRPNEAVVKALSSESDELLLPDDLIVVEGQNRKFYVSGEVRTPGGYPYKEGLTVQKALAMAGGLGEKAEKGNFKIVRLAHGREETVPVTFNSVVLPEDMIVVPEGQKFYVSGEVKTPGRYLYEPGLTGEKVLSLAGGLTDKADKTEIKINRMENGVLRAAALDAQTLILPNDVIVVAPLRKVFVEGEVRQPGHFHYEKGMTVHVAVAMAGGFTDKAAKGRTKVLRIINGEERTIEVNLDTPILPEDIVTVPQRFF